MEELNQRLENLHIEVNNMAEPQKRKINKPPPFSGIRKELG